MSKKARLSLSIALVGLTIIAFVFYATKHHALLVSLQRLPAPTVAWVLLLYILWFGAILFILQASLRLCRKRIDAKENVLLNAYASFVNFFMPGQGGPSIRGVYLKKRHGLKIRTYVLVSLLYYAMYAVVSACLLFVCSRPWWWTIAGMLVAGGGSWAVVHIYMQRSKSRSADLDLRVRPLLALFGATVLQGVVQIALYAVELRAVSPHVGFSQLVTYTGAANFAMFVALTPGAIGVRESFLLFSERLHHIASNTIVAANVIDRGVYLIFLGLLFVLTLALHAKQRLRLKQVRQSAPTGHE